MGRGSRSWFRCESSFQTSLTEQLSKAGAVPADGQNPRAAGSGDRGAAAAMAAAVRAQQLVNGLRDDATRLQARRLSAADARAGRAGHCRFA